MVIQKLKESCDADKVGAKTLTAKYSLNVRYSEKCSPACGLFEL